MLLRGEKHIKKSDNVDFFFGTPPPPLSHQWLFKILPPSPPPPVNDDFQKIFCFIFFFCYFFLCFFHIFFKNFFESHQMTFSKFLYPPPPLDFVKSSMTFFLDPPSPLPPPSQHYLTFSYVFHGIIFFFLLKSLLSYYLFCPTKIFFVLLKSLLSY